MVRLLSGAAVTAGGALAAPPLPVGEARQAVAYGADDRVEWSALPPSPLKTLAGESTVALVVRRRLRWTGEGRVQLSAPPLAAATGLCAGQRFLEQPAAAECTGVLVDRDLVATAAHCVPDDTACRSFRYVLGFALGPDGAVTLDADSVYDCRRIASPAAADSELVVVQLSRAVGPRFGPAPLSGRVPAAGEALVNPSHGQGLPLKVDPGGIVVDVPAGNELLVAVDAFGGASGSPLLLGDGTVAALLQRGRQDYVERGGCLVARSVDARDGAEHATRVATVRDELCAAGWPSERLCARAASCGDGVCSPGETPGACAPDCPAPRCGDGTCDDGEPGLCAADCEPATGAAPFAWYCEDSRHGDGARCDCECGTVDPDCDGRACEAFGPLSLDHPTLPERVADAGAASDAGDAGAPPLTGGSAAAARASGGCSVRRGDGGAASLAGAAVAAAVLVARRRRGVRGRAHRGTRRIAVVAALLGIACHPAGTPPRGAPPPRGAALAPPAPAGEAPGPRRAPEPTAPLSEGGDCRDDAPDAARVSRGVVALVVARGDEPVGTAPRADGDGSAVLVAPGGVAVTSAHVVRGAVRVTALTAGGQALTATVVAADDATDLAVLRLAGDLAGTAPLEWATNPPAPGERVLATGNALGGGMTVTTGIVSEVGRTDLGYARYEDFVVTDAGVVQGMSGGALTDRRARLVGIVTGVLRDGGVPSALGLAVSSRLARPVVDALAGGGAVPRGHLGLEATLVDVHAAAAATDPRAEGARLTSVEAGGPAARAGLVAGDVVVRAGDWVVRRRGNLRAALSLVGDGIAVPVVVRRGGGELTLTLVPGRGPR